MKVLLVSTGSGSRGGGEYYLLILAKALQEQDIDVHLSFPSHPRMAEMRKRGEEIAPVHVVDGKNTYDRLFRQFGALVDGNSVDLYRQLFMHLAPDIIHINQQVLEDGLEIVRAAKRSGYPCVVTTHVTHRARDLGAKYGWLRDRISEYLMSGSGCQFITVSAASRQVLVERLAPRRFADDRVHVVYNGIDCPERLSLEQRESIRRAWGISDDIPIIGVVGRIEQQKNPLFFAKLLAEVSTVQPDFKAVWVGDGLMRPELEKVVREYGLDGKFRIDGWRDDVARRLQAMDIFVLPSKFEGLPLALQEAMCAGLPVCVTNVDGMGELIDDGINGYLCRPDDMVHWVSRLGELIADKEKRKSLGRQARHFAEIGFAKAAMAMPTLAVYSKAIASFGKQR